MEQIFWAEFEQWLLFCSPSQDKIINIFPRIFLNLLYQQLEENWKIWKAICLQSLWTSHWPTTSFSNSVVIFICTFLWVCMLFSSVLYELRNARVLLQMPVLTSLNWLSALQPQFSDESKERWDAHLTPSLSLIMLEVVWFPTLHL